MYAKAVAAGPDMGALWDQVYHRPAAGYETDVDEDLYGGFINNNDKRKLESLRAEKPERLATARPSFDDERLS